jgi:GT2 family glycosyltransferase
MHIPFAAAPEAAQASVAAATLSDPPCVSLLIPVHNRIDLTRPCLDSVFAHSDPAIPTEILIVDDCSSDGTADYLDSLGDRVRVLRNATRQCFGYNMNAAAALAGGEYLALLNNDTIVTEGWLARMLAAIRRDASIGVVGNRQLTPGSNRINHAGMVIDEHGRPIHLYPGKPRHFRPATVSREFQVVTGACWLVPRALFLELGGFDPAFRNGCEDVDFCLRVRAHGRKVWYAADSIIYHYGASSPGRTENDAANERYLAEKWHGRITPDLHDYLVRDGQLPAPAREAPPLPAPAALRGAADLHFAIPLRGGNAFTWVAAPLALACEAAGMVVSLSPGPLHASIDAPARRRLRAMMRRRPSLHAQVKWSHFWPEYQDRELSGRINAEIFVTNYRYGKQPVAALDQWMRHTVLNPNRKLPQSKYCLDALTQLGVPEARCRVVPLGYAPEIIQEPDADDRFRQHGFVFLALTNGHDPYRYGTDILLRAYARAFAGRRDVVLVLKDYGNAAAGPLRNWLAAAPGTPRVIHLPAFLPKAALIGLYRGADALVAPFRGEGFGMKILDACAVGLPVLAPDYGGPADYLPPGAFVPLRYREVPVGDCFDRREGVVPQFARWAEVDADDLADRMRETVLRADDVRRRAMQARQHVLAAYSWQHAASALQAALGDFARERDVRITARGGSVVPQAAISVVIPTRNRPAELTRCLAAYERQTLPRQDWEIVLADDASDYDVGALVAPFAERMTLRPLRCGAHGGPGAARNRAVTEARGAIVLFAGDDIIPAADFLATHVAAHHRDPTAEAAILGHTGWHRDLSVTRLMRHITGAGGQQFAYGSLSAGSLVPYGFFYTSNVSVKRALLARQEQLFSARFDGHYGFEDVELGLRLARDGMRLRYVPSATATHLHAMSDDDVYRRQYRVGRALAVFAMLHPTGISQRDRTRLRWLEAMQHTLADQPGLAALSAGVTEAAGGIASWLKAATQAAATLGDAKPALTLQPAWAAQMFRAQSARWARQLATMFNLRLDLAQCDGMADEWFGVAPEAPNLARDLLRVLFCTDSPLLPDHGGARWELAAESSGGMVYHLARRLRRLQPLDVVWRSCLRVPGALPVVRRGVRLLKAMP